MAVANNEKTWIVGTAVAGLFVVVIGWFLLISPQRSETSDVESRTADAQTQNLTLQGRINALSADSKNRGKFAAELDAARQALPTSGDMSSFLRVAQAIAGTTSTRITSLSVSDPEAFTPSGPAAVAPSSSASSSAASGPTSGSAAAGGPAASGLFDIPLDASVVGSPADLGNFLTRLQSRQPRAVLLTSVTRTTATNGSGVLQLRMKVFVSSPVTSPVATGTPTTAGGG